MFILSYNKNRDIDGAVILPKSFATRFAKDKTTPVLLFSLKGIQDDALETYENDPRTDENHLVRYLLTLDDKIDELVQSIPEDAITSKNKMAILNAANDLIKANLGKRPLVELGFYFKDANFYIPEVDLTPEVYFSMVLQYKTIIDFLNQPLSEEKEPESTTDTDE